MQSKAASGRVPDGNLANWLVSPRTEPVNGAIVNTLSAPSTDEDLDPQMSQKDVD
jgi:hypothetical protein